MFKGEDILETQAQAAAEDVALNTVECWGQVNALLLKHPDAEVKEEAGLVLKTALELGLCS